MSAEQFSRLEILLGKENVEKLHKARILLAGAGAVGGSVLETLARCGIGFIRIADFDRFEESNINRQILALHSTVGRLKTDVAEERVHDIFPECTLEKLNIFIDEENASSVITDVDIVIDCIDNVTAKAALIKACQERNIWIISSMGAARHKDLSKIAVTELSKTHTCPLARALRNRLRKTGGRDDVTVVFSSEKASEDAGQKTLGSLPAVTTVFGQYIANEVIFRIIRQE